VGACVPLDTGEASVLALRYDAPGGIMLSLTNLADRRRTVDLGPQPDQDGDPVEVFGDRAYPAVPGDLTGVELSGYGYRWIRLRETPGR
jgi:maltose alpha-D-glucosyltransferase/alpha-amylase